MKIHTLLATAVITLSLGVFGVAHADNTTKQYTKEWYHPHMDEVISQLPEAKAKLFRDAMQKAHEQNKDTYNQLQQLHEELKTILTADTFDKAAYLDKSKELQGVHDKMMQTMSESFASVAAQFSPGERKILAKLQRGPMMARQGEHGGMMNQGSGGSMMNQDNGESKTPPAKKQ